MKSNQLGDFLREASYNPIFVVRLDVNILGFAWA
jgi:hypothetical protein